MAWLKESWDILLDEDHRERLYLIGAALSAVGVAGWRVFVHFSKKKSTLTKEEYEKGLKRLEEKLLKERAAHPEDPEKQALLEKQLTALEQKRTHLEDSLQATQKVNADIIKLFDEKLSTLFSPNQIKQAKKAINEGDPALAESLLQEVDASGIQQSAEASYQLGLLAKNRVDYKTAWQALSRAAQLAPDNSLYLNEAGLMADNLGHYDTAIQFYERALAIDLETHGPEHPNVATLWNNLGSAWHEKNDYDQSIVYLEKALASDLKTLGPDHPSVARDWNNLGLAWKEKGKYARAIEYYEKALASNLKTFGPEHPRVAIDWNNLGTAWLAKGESDKATGYFEKALASDIETFGPEHPDVARDWNNLGSAWQNKGDTAKAREYYEKALAVVKKAGLEHRVRLVERNIRSLPPDK
ncbi:MAG: tetratricopeptide repeat protein [Nitrospinae bacterium]|nr:tetratricopeptide repeat protein [Nitrospinota bacterium]